MSDSSYAFDAPDTDVIIQAPLQQGSTELKDFRVHKTILSVAPQRVTPPPPIVQIAETAGDFETFLRLIYPIEPPVIESLQLVDHLLQLAEKYMATGVHVKLKQILLSPSFLKNDPILVYAIAYRMSLNKEARLAIPHTFETNLVREVLPDELRMMTGEAYHHLLVEHSLRRDKLANAVDEVCKSRGQFYLCRCAKQLQKEIRLQVSREPFLNREMLEECLSSAEVPHSLCRGTCFLSPRDSPRFLTDLMHRIHEV